MDFERINRLKRKVETIVYGETHRFSIEEKMFWVILTRAYRHVEFINYIHDAVSAGVTLTYEEMEYIKTLYDYKTRDLHVTPYLEYYTLCCKMKTLESICV